MRSYPSIAQALSFGTEEKVAYLDQCLKVSRYNEDAWVRFAQMARRGELNDENKRIAVGHLASLSQTFAGYPDFIWRVFDDLIEVAVTGEKIKQYESVLAQFQKAKRADLACEARLKLTQLQVAESKQPAALAGLTASVREYSTEGRYVPKLLKRMEEVAPYVKGGPAQVANMYIDLVPGMIIYYKSDNTVYFKKMRDQAKLFFEQNSLTQEAATLDARIVQARAAIGKR
jgi:hypothetical protein